MGISNRLKRRLIALHSSWVYRLRHKTEQVDYDIYLYLAVCRHGARLGNHLGFYHDVKHSLWSESEAILDILNRIKANARAH